jgi:hypothetical protein
MKWEIKECAYDTFLVIVGRCRAGLPCEAASLSMAHTFKSMRYVSSPNSSAALDTRVMSYSYSFKSATDIKDTKVEEPVLDSLSFKQLSMTCIDTCLRNVWHLKIKSVIGHLSVIRSSTLVQLHGKASLNSFATHLIEFSGCGGLVQVFADHASSLQPMLVPRTLLWNLRRRFVFFGTSVTSIFRGI